MQTLSAPSQPAIPDPAPAAEAAPQPDPASARKRQPVQIVLVALGAIAFLYFARPVVLPLVVAFILVMALKPVMHWLSCRRVHRSFSAAVVLCLLVSVIGLGCFELGRPALTWMDEAPQHMADLRQRVQTLFPRLKNLDEATVAVSNLGATEAEKTDRQKRAPMVVEVKDGRGSGSLFEWTGAFLVGVGETLVLAYLLLASGDQFMQKLIRVMPTLRDKRRAVDISREVQQNISNYLFSVAMINIGLGLAVSGGLCLMGIPNAPMWGVLVAVLNFVPYFGPVVGILLLTAVGLLKFDTLWESLIPPGWYLLLHFFEANLITPILLGRRFTLNPVVIFVSLIFWTWLWGVPGALLSVPILVSIKVVCDRIPSLSAVSELLAR